MGGGWRPAPAGGDALPAAALAFVLAGCASVPLPLAVGALPPFAEEEAPKRRPEEAPPSWSRLWDGKEDGAPGAPGKARPAFGAEILFGLPVFDGRLYVDGVRTESNRRTLGGGALRAELSLDAWRFEFRVGGAGTESSLGVPDQEPENLYVNADTDNSFSEFQFAAGPCLLDTRPGRKAAGGEGPPGGFGLGTRADLVGGVWSHYYAVTQIAYVDDSDNIVPVEEIETEHASWWLPFVGLRAAHEVSGRVRFEERVDLGGHERGGDLAWRVEALVGVRVSQHVWIQAGWSLQRLRLGERDEDPNRIDAVFSGPFLGIAGRF